MNYDSRWKLPHRVYLGPYSSLAEPTPSRYGNLSTSLALLFFPFFWPETITVYVYREKKKEM